MKHLPQTHNPFEAAARRRKTDALVCHLRLNGVSAATASGFAPSDWDRAAVYAGVHPPSEITAAGVVEALARVPMTIEEIFRRSASAYGEE